MVCDCIVYQIALFIVCICLGRCILLVNDYGIYIYMVVYL